MAAAREAARARAAVCATRKRAMCSGAAEHILELAKRGLDGKKGEEKKLGEAMPKSMGGEMKKAFVKQCKEEEWSQDSLDCIVAAQSERDMDRCKELAERKGSRSRDEKPASADE